MNYTSADKLRKPDQPSSESLICKHARVDARNLRNGHHRLPMAVIIRHEYLAVRQIHSGEDVVAACFAQRLFLLIANAAVILRKAQGHEERPERRSPRDKILDGFYGRPRACCTLEKVRADFQMRSTLAHQLLGYLADGRSRLALHE
jgi:hypothetical protein